MENYIVSARKYRPVTFDTVVGQKALTTTLKNAIAVQKLAHAYLFCGPRGVGKTTCARIFAKTINCLSPTPEGEACDTCESCRAFNEQRSYNIHELDAASNNSVDDIRSLIEQVRIPPQIGRYKVYIIDEVHMLSQAAFNAFLKTLEEPPHHAIFILATTEKHKILPTILSRCQIYDFNRITVQDIVEHLEQVAAKEHITAEPEALNVIAQKADGGMRDALSIFDQVASFTNGKITYARTIENLNVLDYEYYFKLTDFILNNRVSDCMLLFNTVLQKGFDGNHFITGLTAHFRDLLVSKDAQTLPLLEVGASIRERYQQQAQQCSTRFLYKAMQLGNDCDLSYRQSKNKRLLVELTLIRMAQLTEEGGDKDTDGSGRSPKQTLKPIFQKKQATAEAAPENSTYPQQTRQPEPVYQNSRQPAGTDASTQQPTSRVATGSPLPKAAGEKKIPVLKEASINISIRHPHPAQKAEQTPSESSTSPTQNGAEDYEDFIINERDLLFYWHDFAGRLPKEEAANAARMKNMHPRLRNGSDEFDVSVDNEIVLQYMLQLSAPIEKYLREQLHNRKIKMHVHVNASTENIRAYSHLERFQMMAKKNPKLYKLKEIFGLELA